jgi:spermidine/putrescine transport system substrate-binding protein
MEDIEYPPAEYDVLLTDGATIGTLREHELLMPLTYAKVTNLKNISADYRSLSYDPTGEYSITTMWEYVGLLVNTNLVQTQLTSWDVLWDEHYAAQVAMPDHMEDALAVTLLAMGENPASDASVRLNAALDKLEAQQSLVVSYSGRDASELLQSDQAALYPCWSGDALAMMRENPALVYLLPPGGTYRTTFGYALPADSVHTDDAYTFINYMCEAESLAKNAVYSKYASTSDGAINKLDESWSDNPVIYPEASVLSSTPLLNPLPLDVADHCMLRWRAISVPEVTDPADGEGDSSASALPPAEGSGVPTDTDVSGERSGS